MSAIHFTGNNSPNLRLQQTLPDPTEFLRTGADFPYRTPLTAQKVLSKQTSQFFSEYRVPSDFSPYRNNPTDPIHAQFKKIADSFERRYSNQTLDNQLQIAEAIANEVRNSPTGMAPLYELGLRYHLTDRLLNMQAALPRNKLGSLGKIHQFMTVKNTYIIPSVEWIGQILDERHIPRIAERVARLWTLTPSFTDNLLKAQNLVAYYVQGIHKIINQRYLEEEQRKIHAVVPEFVTATVDTVDISMMLLCVDTVFRNALAHKLVTHTANACKSFYAKTGQLPANIAQTLKKITQFMKLSDESTAIRRELFFPCNPAKETPENITEFMESLSGARTAMRGELFFPCNPAKDFVSQLFGSAENIPAVREKIEKQAHEKHDQIDQRFLYRIFPRLSADAHTATDRFRENQLDTLDWAEAQFSCDKPTLNLLTS